MSEQDKRNEYRRLCWQARKERLSRELWDSIRMEPEIDRAADELIAGSVIGLVSIVAFCTAIVYVASVIT